MELTAPLKRGDGVVFDAGAPGEPEQGGAVYDVLAPDGRLLPGGQALNPSTSLHGPCEPPAPGGPRPYPSDVLLMFGPGCMDGGRVAPGSLVWRSSDPELEACLRATYEGLPAAAARRLPVDVAVAGRLGQARRCQCYCSDGVCCNAQRVPTALDGVCCDELARPLPMHQECLRGTHLPVHQECLGGTQAFFLSVNFLACGLCAPAQQATTLKPLPTADLQLSSSCLSSR